MTTIETLSLVELIRESFGLNWAQLSTLIQLVAEKEVSEKEIEDLVQASTDIMILGDELVLKRDPLEEKGIKFKRLNPVKVDSWVNDYRNLFYEYSNKLPTKDSKSSVKEKLTWFMENFPYDKETIMKAAELYLQTEAKKDNYKFVQKAGHFIVKGAKSGGAGRIENYCEMVTEGVTAEQLKNNADESNHLIAL